MKVFNLSVCYYHGNDYWDQLVSELIEIDNKKTIRLLIMKETFHILGVWMS